MKRNYSIADARAHLSEVVRAAERGQPVRLARRGTPVAIVVSVAEYEALQSGSARFLQAWEEFQRQGVGADLDDAEVASWRDRDPGRPVKLG